MGKSLAEVDNLAADELHKWMIYDALFPFGAEREDWRSANICQVLANCHSSKKSYSVSDFMLPAPKTEKQKADELKAKMTAAVARVEANKKAKGARS